MLYVTVWILIWDCNRFSHLLYMIHMILEKGKCVLSGQQDSGQNQ